LFKIYQKTCSALLVSTKKQVENVNFAWLGVLLVTELESVINAHLDLHGAILPSNVLELLIFSYI